MMKLMRENRIPTMPQAEERIPTMPQTDGRIPTMPQVEERIPTMPQNDGRIPTMPQNDGRVPTIPQHDGRVPTVPQMGGRTATVPQGGYNVGGSSNGGIVSADCSFAGVRGGHYKIHASQIISADSGESQIYGCSQEYSSEKYVARVLKSITPASPVDKLIQREKVLHFLLQNSNNPDAHILPLFDHGTINQGGREYFVEVYPFCEGGDLGQKKGAISYKTISKEIVPAINKALHTFHCAGFVHRDVKPDNLYYYNGRVVLGDFGITCELVNNGFAIDKTKTGTLGYYAPELMSQAAVKASDYYSFGQTLWTLYSGEMMYQNILRRYRSEGIETQRNQVNFAMLQDTYYGLEEIKKEEHFFEILIRGLLQYDVGSRFNYEQVERWTKGDLSLAHEISKYHDLDTYPVHLLVDGVKCWNHEQLCDCFKNNWEGAKELLFSGELRSFFQHINPKLAHEIDQIARVYSKAPKNRRINVDTMNDIGVSRLMLLLNKGKSLVWGDVVYESISDLGKPVMPAENVRRRYHASEKGFLCSGLIADWYTQWQTDRKELVDEYVLKCLIAAQEYVTDTSWDTTYDIAASVSRAIVQQVFSAMSGQSRFENCGSLEELAVMLSGKTSEVYTYLQYSLLWNPEFHGFLYAQGFAEFSHKLLTKGYSNLELLELLFVFLEQQTENEENRRSLVDFYINHGPDAYLLWFKNHLNLYEFNGEEANALCIEIQNCQIGGTTIAEVQASYSELMRLVVRFRTLFVDNVYMAQMGLTGGKEKNGITSSHLFAYWHKKLLGRDVPIGFDIT